MRGQTFLTFQLSVLMPTMNLVLQSTFATDALAMRPPRRNMAFRSSD